MWLVIQPCGNADCTSELRRKNATSDIRHECGYNVLITDCNVYPNGCSARH